MSEFNGKTVVVTGGNSGIGLQTALMFRDAGANIVVCGRNPETLAQAKELLGTRALVTPADVTDLEQLDELVKFTKDRFGSVDALFANAGIAAIKGIADIEEDDFDHTVNTNFKGVFFTVKKFLRIFNDGGSIILNSSMSHSQGPMGLSVYCASKAAIRSLARTLASELKFRNIRINCVSPGPIETPFLKGTGKTQQQGANIESQLASEIPLGRFGQPQEIANAVFWLASSQSSYVTGIDLSVDGGAGQV